MSFLKMATRKYFSYRDHFISSKKSNLFFRKCQVGKWLLKRLAWSVNLKHFNFDYLLGLTLTTRSITICSGLIQCPAPWRGCWVTISRACSSTWLLPGKDCLHNQLTNVPDSPHHPVIHHLFPPRRGGRAGMPQPMQARQAPARQQHNEGYVDRVFWDCDIYIYWVG